MAKKGFTQQTTSSSLTHLEKEGHSLLRNWKPFLQEKGVKNIAFVHRGKRGVIFKGDWKGKVVGIKVKRETSSATDRIHIEAMNLRKTNTLGIGPKLLEAGEQNGEHYLVYEFAQGVLVGDFLSTCTQEQWNPLVIALLEQMYLMDCAQLTKEEMHNPYKHVVICNETSCITLLDFERMHADPAPKNVSQCVQYLTSGKVRRRFKTPLPQEVQPLLQKYKRALEDFHAHTCRKAKLDALFLSILSRLTKK